MLDAVVELDGLWTMTITWLWSFRGSSKVERYGDMLGAVADRWRGLGFCVCLGVGEVDGNKENEGDLVNEGDVLRRAGVGS